MKKLLIGVFFIFPFFYLHAVHSEHQIEVLIESGKQHFNNGNLSQALTTFNRAMGYLREVPKNHPLLNDLEHHIRLTKGKLLVQRYNKNHNEENEMNGNALHPISEESDDIEVNQFFGSVLAREVWQNKKINKIGDNLGFGRRVTVLPSAGVELSYVDGYKYKFRAVEAASFALSNENVFDFHSGSFSLASLERNSLCLVKSPLSEFHLKSDDPFAVLFAVTTNGGLKIIGLLGEIELVQKTKPSISLRPGQLIFSMPDGFSRKMSVELSTLMVTSKLMTAFEDPPNFYRKLKQQALIQALRTKKRFRTLVGDAKTNSDFQIKVLESE
ncbi:MAG: hypothetical protein HN553_03935 [Opitutae bacterium]|jgi:hypothetical protein|nr:hypothetical protein [Opitutae bacterium]